jgi:hypothetical protein
MLGVRGIPRTEESLTDGFGDFGPFCPCSSNFRPKNFITIFSSSHSSLLLRFFLSLLPFSLPHCSLFAYPPAGLDRPTRLFFSSSEKRLAHSANSHPNTSNTWLHEPNHHPRVFTSLSTRDDAFSRFRSLSLRLRLGLAELHGSSRPDCGAGI